MSIGAWESLEQSQNCQGELEIEIGGSIADTEASEKKGFKESVASRSWRLKYIVSKSLLSLEGFVSNMYYYYSH